jgi:hypothetical protein
MYYLDENMLKSVQPVATETANPPAAPAPVSAASKRVSEKNSAKQADNRKSTSMTVLPAATSNVNKLVDATPVETKTVETDSNLVTLDEPPPPRTQRILKPVSGGVLNGTALTLPPPVYPDCQANENIWHGDG